MVFDTDRQETVGTLYSFILIGRYGIYGAFLPMLRFTPKSKHGLYSPFSILISQCNVISVYLLSENKQYLYKTLAFQIKEPLHCEDTFREKYVKYVITIYMCVGGYKCNFYLN